MATLTTSPPETDSGSLMLHHADISEGWFTEHMKKHPGLRS